MKKNLIMCAIALLATQAMSYTHSDIEMEEMIAEAFRVAEENRFGTFREIIDMRCPYKELSHEEKIAIVDCGLEDGHYSIDISDRLKDERLYPVTSKHPKTRVFFVAYLCSFSL